jgi:hypothetical protein
MWWLKVETPKANLVAGMKWLLGTYTSRFNRRHKLFGWAQVKRPQVKAAAVAAKLLCYDSCNAICKTP